MDFCIFVIYSKFFLEAQHCRCLFPVTTKVKSACRLTGNVGDHDEDEESVVVEREVVLVGESDRVQACLLHVRQRCIDSQQFSSHSHGIQHNEKGVPKEKAGERNNKSLISLLIVSATPAPPHVGGRARINSKNTGMIDDMHWAFYCLLHVNQCGSKLEHTLLLSTENVGEKHRHNQTMKKVV